MPAPKAPGIEVIDRVEWQHDVSGSAKLVGATLLSNHELLGADAPVNPIFIGNGLGEKGWSERKALKRAAEHGRFAITARANVEQVPATVADITGFASNYMPRVAERTRTDYYDDDRAVDATGESMGGAFLGIAVREASEEFEGTIFCQPAGHDVAVMLRDFPDDDERRDDMLQGRFPRVMLRPYPFTREGARPWQLGKGRREATLGQMAHAAWDLGITQIVPDILKQRINPKFDSVVSPELLGVGGAGLDHAADGHRVGYVFGGMDPLIIERLVRESLAIEAGDDERRQDALANKVAFVTVPDRRHGYMGFPAALDNLSIAIGMLGVTAGMKREEGEAA